MGLTTANCRIFGQPEPGRPLMWGSAAWAQTQLTPGVSTLAAPRSSIKPPSRGVEGQSRGAGQRKGERKRMTGGRAAQEAAKLLAGGAGLFAGLSLLGTAPLTAVLVMLAAMSYMLIPAAKLGGGGSGHCRRPRVGPRASAQQSDLGALQP